MTRKKREINTSLLDSVTADMLGGGEVDFLLDDSLRVERMLLDLVRPDPLQPRRVLPDRIYHAFHAGQLTPSQALRELIQVAQLAGRQNGRTFTNVLELLGNPDDEHSEELPSLSPEEQLVRDLVNPLTVVDVTEGVTRLFRIETGERRYWATWLLRDFIPGYDSDGMIPCIVIPAESSSAFRQAKENTARSGLSAIAMARQAALLLMYVHGYEMPNGPVPFDFYRQALDLDLRGKREHTTAILSAMGGMSKFQFRRYKALLQLSDEASELADRHALDEGRLRYVTALEPQDQIELIRQIVQFGLTRKQIKELCEGDAPVETNAEEEKLPKQVVQLAKIMKSSLSAQPHQLAQILINQEKDVHLARARLQRLRELLNETETLLDQV